MKKYRDELAKNARAVLRFFDTLKEKGKGDLHEGVILPSGTRIRIQMEIKTNYNPNFAISPATTSYKILMAAYYLSEKVENVIFVSKDLAMRVKAKAMGIGVEDYENQKFAYETLYRGFRKIEMSKHGLIFFIKMGRFLTKLQGKISCLMNTANELCRTFNCGGKNMIPNQANRCTSSVASQYLGNFTFKCRATVCA